MIKELSFRIKLPDRNIRPLLQKKVDQKTKPVGALGRLEKLAVQIGMIQQSESPELTSPHIIIFAGDHGIATEGVSAYPQEVTHQMVLNFLAGGAAINVFTKQHNVGLTVVDAGVNFDFGELRHPGFIPEKIDFGTSNILCSPAMTRKQFAAAFRKGAEIMEELSRRGTNITGFGEMGIGNTSSASLVMSALTALPVNDCVGRGTGISDEALQKKTDILYKALSRSELSANDPAAVLQYFGGFEMAMMAGAMMKAAEKKMILLVDGFIATVVFLCAYRSIPEILDYAVFCHCSDEKAHRLLLDHIGAEPLLDLSLRLGEGTGCAVAYPLVQSAVSFLNEMASFEEAGVQSRDEDEA